MGGHVVVHQGMDMPGAGATTQHMLDRAQFTVWPGHLTSVRCQCSTPVEPAMCSPFS